MSVRERWLASLSIVAFSLSTFAIPLDASAESAAPARDLQAQPLPPINVTAQKKRAPARGRQPAPTTVPAEPAEAAPSTTPSVTPNVAASAWQTDPVSTASEQQVSGERVNEMPSARPGEFLEVTPGLVVTQHSGEGKANQYFLRGFNLDHGTDLAITIDGLPVNMRTHGHGQGWADINFLIPELISGMRIRKGPYFADEGDFSSAGSLHIEYRDTFNPGLWQGTIGMFGYGRALAIKSAAAGAGNLLVAPGTTVPGMSPTACASSMV